MEEKPKDITELDFFTRQIIEPDGFAFFWVYKPKCPACSGARLKKLKKRDKIYACAACKKAFEPAEYNALLKYNLEYTCPKCKNKGELFGSWNKPKLKTAPTMLKFACEKCSEKLKVLRMKKAKKKKAKENEAGI
jgi:DNA-directed RNA polymerase subunit M/transcription elongation factor TFIIS